MRDGAGLHITVVSDEDDASGDSPISRAEFIAYLQNVRFGQRKVSFSSIVGPLAGCADIGEPGTDYIAVTRQVGGVFWPICEPEWTQILDELGFLAVGLSKEFFLSQRPVPGTIQVVVEAPGGGSQKLAEGKAWTYQPRPEQHRVRRAHPRAALRHPGHVRSAGRCQWGSVPRKGPPRSRSGGPRDQRSSATPLEELGVFEQVGRAPRHALRGLLDPENRQTRVLAQQGIQATELAGSTAQQEPPVDDVGGELGWRLAEGVENQPSDSSDRALGGHREIDRDDLLLPRAAAALSSRPRIRMPRRGSGRRLATRILRVSAVRSPMAMPRSRRNHSTMAASSASPATGTEPRTTIPPRLRIATWLRPAPTSTIIEATGSRMGSSAPSAAAMGLATSSTTPAPAARTLSWMARRSTSLVPLGTQTNTLGRRNPVAPTSRSRALINRSVASKSATTPPRTGRMTWVSAGARAHHLRRLLSESPRDRGSPPGSMWPPPTARRAPRHGPASRSVCGRCRGRARDLRQCAVERPIPGADQSSPMVWKPRVLSISSSGLSISWAYRVASERSGRLSVWMTSRSPSGGDRDHLEGAPRVQHVLELHDVVEP